MRRARTSKSTVLVLCLAFAWGCAMQNPAAKLNDGEKAYREGRTSDAELIWLENLAEAENYGEDDPRLKIFDAGLVNPPAPQKKSTTAS